MKYSIVPALFAFLTIAGPAIANAHSQSQPESPSDKGPLQVPAMKSAIAPRSSLIGVAVAGKRLVGVGLRGVIVYSGDQGKHWKQAQVPVSADLTAVSFPTPKQGWAVGHDGVVLHSRDGGRTWKVQFNGWKATKLLAQYYKKQVNAGHKKLKRLLKRSEWLAKYAPAVGFLGVWFKNTQTGYIVGEFGLILKTVDGGKTWKPLASRAQNPHLDHIYGIRGADGHIYIAGERGLFLRRKAASDTFSAVKTPYTGSYFGVAAQGNLVMIYGLRGRAYISRDAGRTWHKAATKANQTFTAGAIKDGLILLTTETGKIYYSKNQGKTFDTKPLSNPPAIYGMALINTHKVALVGPSGLWVDTLHSSK